jgi:MerR family regulatory protein
MTLRPHSAEELFTIGEVAQRTGKAASTIRYYEEIGLIPPPLLPDTADNVGSSRDLDSPLRFAGFSRPRPPTRDSRGRTTPAVNDFALAHV